MKKVFLLLAMAMAISSGFAQPPPTKLKLDTVGGTYLSDSASFILKNARLVRVTTLTKQFVQPKQADPNKQDSVVVHTDWQPAGEPVYYVPGDTTHPVHAFFDYQMAFWPKEKPKKAKGP